MWDYLLLAIVFDNMSEFADILLDRFFDTDITYGLLPFFILTRAYFKVWLANIFDCKTL